MTHCGQIVVPLHNRNVTDVTSNVLRTVQKTPQIDTSDSNVVPTRCKKTQMTS
jgi:hypothetical protein